MTFSIKNLFLLLLTTAHLLLYVEQASSMTTSGSINLGPDQTFLFGDNAVVTLDAGSGFINYQWTPNASTQSISVDISALAIGQYDYSVTATDATGISCIDDITIIVEAVTPCIDLGPDQTFLFGDNSLVTLDAGSGFINYQWTPNASTQSISVDISTLAIGQYDYSVTATDATGISCIDDITIIVEAPTPCFDLGPDQVFLFGDNAVVTLDAGSGFINYQWAPNASTQSISVDISTLAIGQYDYSVTATDAIGISCTDYITIIVEAPTPCIDLGPDQVYCEGENATITLDAGPGFLNYLWTTGGSTQSTSIDLIDLAAGEYVVAVLATRPDRSTCTAQVTITIAEAPIAEVADNHLCEGELVEIHFTGEEYGPVFLHIEGFPGPIPMSNSPFYAMPEPGVYTISNVSSSLCSSGQIISDNVVTVGTLCIDLGPDITRCEYENEDISFDAGPGYTSYLWSTGETTQQITVNPVSFESGAYNFSVTVTNSSGQTGSDEAILTLAPTPLVGIVDNSICLGDYVELTFTGGNEFGPVIIDIDVDAPPYYDGPIEISMNNSPYFDLPAFPGEYNIIGVRNAYCSTGQVVTNNALTVSTEPEVDLGNDQQICNGSSIELYNLSSVSADSYAWYNQNTGALIGTDPTVTVFPTSTTTYALEVLAGGCTSVDEVIIYPFVCPKLSLDETATTNEEVKAFPNPFTSALNIVITPEVDDEVKLTMYDLNGNVVRVIYNGSVFKGTPLTLNSTTFDLAAGTYLLEMRGTEGSHRVLLLNHIP